MGFPFYHGTSEIFLNSIKENGLGGLDPNIDFKNLNVLTFLVNESEKYLLDNKEYLEIREIVKAIVLQTDLIKKMSDNKSYSFNFRHKGVYLSLDKRISIFHAGVNKYGSEVLGFCIKLFSFLKSKFNAFEIPKELNLFKIEKYLEVEKSKPILVEIDNLDYSKVNVEGQNKSFISLGKECHNLNVDSVDEKMDFLFKHSFNTLSIIPLKNLKFYRIEFKGKVDIKLNYEWSLFEIG